MTGTTNHNMRIGIGYNIDHAGIEKLAQAINTLNESTKGSATSFKAIEQSIRRLSNAQQQQNEATRQGTQHANSYIQTLKNEVNAGVLPLEQAYTKLYDVRRKTMQRAEKNQATIDILKAERSELGKGTKAYKEKTEQLHALQAKQREYTTIIASQNTTLNNWIQILGKANKTVDTTINEFQKFATFIKTQYKAGTISAKEATDALEQEIKQLELALKNVGKGDGAYVRLNKQLADAKNTVKTINNDISRSLKNTWQQYNQQYAAMQNQMKASSTLVDFTAGVGNTFKNDIIRAGVNLAFVRNITAQVQKAITDIKNIDYNLINTQRIMGDFSNETANYLMNNATEIAKATNIQITDAQNIQAAWVRINDEYAKNRELLSEISMLTSKFMNVGEIENAEDAVTLLNASLLQFGVSADDAIEKSEEFLNKWAYMADITAMGTADEYGTAIARFGAQLDSLGGTMDDAIALSSVMADSLAKNGEEAGNALKTFTVYLNREKTVNLFNKIAEDLGSTSYQLMDANGRFKEFEDTLRTVAQAYQIYAQAGNDAMAQDILNAVGATRQRDTALAILNSVNDGSYNEYKQKSTDDSVGGYLDQQNTALLETFTAKWNEMTVAIEEFAMAFARNGLLDGVGLLMEGFSGLLSILSSVPAPVMKVVNAFIGLKAAQAAGQYIGKLTGITKSYQQLMQHGTKEEIANATAVNQSVNAYKVRQEAYIDEMLQKNQLNQLSEQEQAQLSETITAYHGQRIALLELEQQYNNSEITASRYVAKVHEIVSSEQLAANSKNQDTIATQQNTAANIQNTVSEQQNTEAEMQNTAANIQNTNAEMQNINAEQQDTNATLLNTNATQQNTTATQQNTTSETKNTIVRERGILGTLKYAKAKFEETKKTVQGNSAKIADVLANKLVNSSLGQVVIGSNSASAAQGILATAFKGVGTAASYAAGGLSAVMSVISPIFFALSSITMIWSLVSSLFGVSDSAEDASQSLNELESELDEVQSRIENLEDLNRSGGLTNGEKAELEFLEQKNELLKENVKLKQQEINNDEWNSNGGFLGWGTDDHSKESLENLIDDYNELAELTKNYGLALKGVNAASAQGEEYSKRLAKSNTELRETAGELAEEYYRLKENYDSGLYSGDAEKEVGEKLKELEQMMPTIEAILKSTQNLSDTIGTLGDEVEEFGEDIESISGKISTLNDLFKEYNEEGYLSYETVSELVAEHPEYIKYLVKVGDQYKLNKLAEDELNQANKNLIETTDEMIAKLGEQDEVGQQVSQDMIDAVDAVDNFTIGINDTFGNIEGVTEFVDSLRDINIELLKGNSTIEEYNTSMNRLIQETDFSKVNDELDGVDEKTKQAIQSQQAMFTSMAQEISNYIVEITNALYMGEMSANEYVNALQGSNQNVLDMYTESNDLILNQAGYWVDATGAVNDYANSLQSAIDGLNGMSEATQFLQDHQVILSELQQNLANNVVDSTWWAANEQSNAYQTMADDFSGLMEYLFVNNKDAWDAIVADVDKAGFDTTNIMNNSNGAITETAQGNAAVMGAFTTATMNSVGDSVNRTMSAAGNVITAFGDMIKNFDYELTFTPETDLKFDLKNLLEGESPFEGSGLKLKITGKGGTSVENFANSLSSFGSTLKGIDVSSFFSNIGSYTPRGYTPSGANGLAGGKYSPSSYDRSTPATRTPTKTSGGSSNGKSDAEKAAEEALKAIEKFTNEYVKNVESMQDRIAKALKKKYQEHYDERKKLLEKEHNERVAVIQAEIDALEGNRPEDKQARLSNLKEQLALWQQDNSSLGKAKQKELSDQIADLNKEIQLDALNQKLEDENEAYQNSIDSDSEFYDATLAYWEKMMSDEYIYKEANKLIKNNKQQEIINLLKEYDEKWDGWGTLMGKTAGEIIAEEVALAIANYKDVKNGTIDENGGKNTLKVTSGSSIGFDGNKDPDKPSTNKPIKVGGKAKISNTSAGMYTTSTSSSKVNTWKGYSGSFYVVNTSGGRAALARTNNINGAIGWIDKKYLVGLATGGYTGNSEGLAMLHKKERVLDARQTSAFENLVYDFLPKISSHLLNPNGDTYNNGNNVTFNRELVKVDIGTVVNNKQFDIDNGIDNLDRAFRKSLRKSGINLKK